MSYDTLNRQEITIFPFDKWAIEKHRHDNYMDNTYLDRNFISASLDSQESCDATLINILQ